MCTSWRKPPISCARARGSVLARSTYPAGLSGRNALLIPGGCGVGVGHKHGAALLGESGLWAVQRLLTIK